MRTKLFLHSVFYFQEVHSTETPSSPHLEHEHEVLHDAEDCVTVGLLEDSAAASPVRAVRQGHGAGVDLAVLQHCLQRET